jgi:hypothetical protein
LFIHLFEFPDCSVCLLKITSGFSIEGGQQMQTSQRRSLPAPFSKNDASRLSLAKSRKANYQ